MVAGAKVCELTEDLLWFVCGNFDVFPKAHEAQNEKLYILKERPNGCYGVQTSDNNILPNFNTQHTSYP